MDELKTHAKETARRLFSTLNLQNEIFEAAEQASTEYVAELGVERDSDIPDRIKDQYMQYFTDEIRDSIR